jgi:hypothetical protein
MSDGWGGGKGGIREEGLPATLAGTILLGLLGIGVNVAGLGEVAGEVLGGEGGAISEAGVVAVIVLVRLAHCKTDEVSSCLQEALDDISR